MSGFSKQVTFEVGDRKYIAELNINALCALQEAIGTKEKPATFQDVLGVLRAADAGTDMIAKRQVFWASLLQHQPSTTINEAGLVMDGIGAMVTVLSTLAEQASPDPEDLAELRVHDRPRKAQRQRRGAGGSSTSAPGRLA